MKNMLNDSYLAFCLCAWLRPQAVIGHLINFYFSVLKSSVLRFMKTNIDLFSYELFSLHFSLTLLILVVSPVLMIQSHKLNRKYDKYVQLIRSRLQLDEQMNRLLYKISENRQKCLLQ